MKNKRKENHIYNNVKLLYISYNIPHIFYIEVDEIT
jgi:hypothetical protein